LEQHINPEEDKNEIKEKEKRRMLMVWREKDIDFSHPEHRRLGYYAYEVMGEAVKRKNRKTTKTRTRATPIKNRTYVRPRKKTTLNK
jgi:ABC-type molybdate transport system substrate-binding protein